MTLFPQPEALTRRRFLCLAAGATVAARTANAAKTTVAARKGEAKPETLKGRVMTVLGPIPARAMGFTLPHEHVLCDFIGAENVSRDRYDADEAFRVMRPFLMEAKGRGVRSFVDCTPMFIGRDPQLLLRLSRETGLHLLTNTGLYKEPFLPDYAFKESAEALADRWTREFTDGIEGTEIRPGFIKIAVNPGKLLEVQKKILRAAMITSRRTGLAIGCHTGHAEAAMESLDLLRKEKFPLRKYIVIHSDGIGEAQERVAQAGAWVSLDAVGGLPIVEHVKMITALIGRGHVGRLLLSHDAGWYNVGDPKGGTPRPFTALSDSLLPALRSAGVTEGEIRRLTVTNPRQAFALG